MNRLEEVNESAQNITLSDEGRSPRNRRNGKEILMDTGSKNESQYLDRKSQEPSNKKTNEMQEGISDAARLKAETM